MRLLRSARARATTLTLMSCPAALLAQHPAPIAISNTAPTSPERTAVDARMSPDGQFVAYSTTGGSGASTTHSLFVRRADASTASVQVTSILPSTTTPFFPNIPFAWRQQTPTSGSRLLFGERTVAGGTNLREFDPATGVATTRATFAPPASGTDFLFLQLHPCRNVVCGVLTNFQGLLSSLDRVWHVNLTGGVPVFPAGATATGQLIAGEMTPDETRGIFSEHPSNGTRIFQFSVASGAVTQIANATASPVTVGCLDNGRAYGIDSATNQLAAWSLPPAASNVPITINPAAAVFEAAASPGNLVGPGTKEFLAFVNGLNEVRMTPSDYGGEILLTPPPATFSSCLRVSIDGAATGVAFIASSGATRQVFVVPTSREIRATYTHPTGSSTVTYNVVAPCAANEICVMAASLGLTTTPVPFGPPGSGQIDLDSSAIVLGSSVGTPYMQTTVQTFNPAAVGQTLFFQAGRLDVNTGAFLNTTHAAGVRYF